MEIPDVQYARSGDLAIAYQTFGHGPRDIVFIPMFSNIVFPWANADWRATYERFASFGRLIMFDKRGEQELKGVGAWRIYSVVDA